MTKTQCTLLLCSCDGLLEDEIKIFITLRILTNGKVINYHKDSSKHS
jgi:hypothetical protein